MIPTIRLQTQQRPNPDRISYKIENLLLTSRVVDSPRRQAVARGSQILSSKQAKKRKGNSHKKKESRLRTRGRNGGGQDGYGGLDLGGNLPYSARTT